MLKKQSSAGSANFAFLILLRVASCPAASLPVYYILRDADHDSAHPSNPASCR